MKLKGVLIDSTGKPVEGAFIDAYYAPNRESTFGWQKVGIGLTDTKGGFELETKTGDKIALKYQLPGATMSNFFDGKWFNDCVIYTQDNLNLQLKTS